MKKRKSKFKITISIITIFINLYCLFIFSNIYESNYSPSLSKTNLQSVLSKPTLKLEDYSLIYSQTGLSKLAIDDLLLQKNAIETILSFQNNYFSKIGILPERINPFTVKESIVANGIVNKNNMVAPLKNGDILLTKSVHTLYWRHGHCGIVVDAENGIILESLTPGTFSKNQNISKWQYYPTLKVMRLKGADSKKLEEIVLYAKENLMGIKYKILALKRYNDNKLEGSNCSQMIWQAFNHFGYDLDSNKGIIVTPEDIAKSDLLEIVQVFGFNPQKDW